jgi:hypothetical protein
VPDPLVNIISAYDVDIAENAPQEIKALVDRDMSAVTYQPLVHPHTPAFHPPLAAAPRPSQKVLGDLVVMSSLSLTSVCAKRLLWNGGLKVLWRGLAYGPGQIETWMTMACAEVGSFIGLGELGNKIFNSSVWRNDKYVEVGRFLFINSCLFLNMMVIDSFITKRLNPA